jgi:hypothetical protein
MGEVSDKVRIMRSHRDDGTTARRRIQLRQWRSSTVVALRWVAAASDRPYNME